MTTISVKVDIPDGWELADEKMRPAKRGEFYYSGLKVEEWNIPDECYHNVAILRKKWVWPKWLKVGYIAMNKDGVWLGYQCLPYLNQTHWISNGNIVNLNRCLLDFDPPPCDDWKTSLRENPNDF